MPNGPELSRVARCRRWPRLPRRDPPPADREVKGGARLGYDYIHACVDDHSRVAYVEVHSDERGETCARFLARACEFYAELGVKVEAVMTEKSSVSRT